MKDNKGRDDREGRETRSSVKEVWDETEDVDEKIGVRTKEGRREGRIFRGFPPTQTIIISSLVSQIPSLIPAPASYSYTHLLTSLRKPTLHKQHNANQSNRLRLKSL
jgi:hypothetical protein